MLKEGKFGPQEAVCLVAIAISSKTFFSSHAFLAGTIGNTTWIMVLISGSVALVGFWFVCKLLERFPGKDIVEIFEITCGRVVGFILSFILGLYLLMVAIMIVNELSEFLKVYVLTLSPPWFITGIMILSVFILTSLGLEAMARSAKILSAVLAIGFAGVLILGVQGYNTYNIFPIFGYGLGKIVLTGLMRSSAYSEVIVLAVFAKSLQGTEFIKREGMLSIILGILVFSISNLAISLTFPYYVAQELTSPMFELAKTVEYGTFVQRVEAIFLFTWITTSFISVCITFYAFIWIYCKIFRMPDIKPVVVGSTAILYAVSMMHGDISIIVYGYVNLIRVSGVLPVFIFPIIALIAAKARKKGVRQNA